MSNLTPIDIAAFRGIDARHTRQPNNLADAKNIFVRNGMLFSRRGTTLVSTHASMTNSITSVHSAVEASYSRLLAQESTNLWHRQTTAGTWANLKTDCAAAKFDSCRWQQYLILANGTNMMAYDIAAGTLANLGGTPPAMRHVFSWRSRIFGFDESGSNPNYLWFCGYTDMKTRKIVDKDVWPATFFLNVSDSSGIPVLAAIPMGEEVFLLTSQSYAWLKGIKETNFATLQGGSTSLINANCAKLVGRTVVWLGLQDDIYEVYCYTGSQPVPISAPIEGLYGELSFANPWGFVGSKDEYWLMLPNSTTSVTDVLVFNVMEQQWTGKYQFPFIINCATLYGDYLGRGYIHFGISASQILKYDESLTDYDGSTGATIGWEFNLGPINYQNRRMRIKKNWMMGQPDTGFTADVYYTVDTGEEQGPYGITFESGKQTSERADVGTPFGHNTSLRIAGTDRLTNLKSATLLADIKDVK